ncbi:Panacea domain-containing protein [Inquilinus sp. OTU3971]|uniref:Panacea domain-containing protein n=1 Tax=Inquilinus sp. OTU3971 TaxID=3043855 RepID=UPI00313B6757
MSKAATVGVADVARHILDLAGPMTAMKLQKLVYYAQAWSLVWDERPLFAERIEAWANGPVCPDLYERHRGRFQLGSSDIVGDPSRLDSEAMDTIRAVVDFYGNKSAHWLSQLTHKERPWKEARHGLADGDRGSTPITHAALAEYYSSL